MSEAIAGAIERVTFHNPETGFVVLRALLKGQRHPVTVVGQTARAVAGSFSMPRAFGMRIRSMAGSSRRIRFAPRRPAP